MMAIVPPLAHLLQTSHAVRAELPCEVNSLCKLARVVQVTRHAKFGRDVTEKLEEAVDEHGGVFVEAHTKKYVKYKLHVARKLARQAERDGFAMDAIVCERKHSLMKPAADPIDNTSEFEASLMARALVLHKATLQADFSDGLLASKSHPELARQLGAEEVYVGKDMRLDGTVMGSGDIVFIGSDLAAEITCACSLIRTGSTLKEYGFLVHQLSFVEEVSSLASRWQVAGALSFLPAIKGNGMMLSPLWVHEERGFRLVFN